MPHCRQTATQFLEVSFFETLGAFLILLKQNDNHSKYCKKKAETPDQSTFLNHVQNWNLTDGLGSIDESDTPTI